MKYTILKAKGENDLYYMCLDYDATLWLANTQNNNATKHTALHREYSTPPWFNLALQFGSASAAHAFAGAYFPLSLIEHYKFEEEKWIKQDALM